MQVFKPFQIKGQLKSDGASNWPLRFTALAAILAATIYGYHAVIANFFNGDDFVHLSWLSQAVKNPDLIWRNFHSAWLDISTARFYRPLISLFMLSDYVLWKGNGIGFHLTNLFCHLLNTILLWLIIIGLPRPASNSHPDSQHEGSSSTGSTKVDLWGLSSAALFALYPLHPEAVSWITGRVDTIVTMFCLSSLWCFMRWRRSPAVLWLLASCSSLILALLSKEMAVIMPPLFVVYGLIFNANVRSLRPDSTNNFKLLGQSLHKSLQKTWAYWLILFAYFIVRRLALGTFIGGYDDSLFAIPSRSLFIKNWLHSIGMTLLPMNKDLFMAYHPAKTIWIILMVVSFLSGITSLIKQSSERPRVLFLLAWLILTLVPIFKLFNIGDDLQGSRLIYFGSAPLSALICFGFFQLRFRLFAQVVGYVLISLTLAFSSFILITNNTPWQQSGEMSRAIVQRLDQFYMSTEGDPPVYLVGLPDNIAGAYVCRNALDGMTKYPQICRSVKNCFMLTDSEHSFPFGFSRESIQNRSNSKILRWDSDRLQFHLLALPISVAKVIPSWQLVTVAETIPKHRSLVMLTDHLPCWSTDIITLHLRATAGLQKGSDSTISLMYKNDLQKTFSLSKRIASNIENTTSEQSISFPLHGDVDWSMGGDCHQLELLYPGQCQIVIDKLEITPLYDMVPKLSFKNTANQNSLGYIELNQNNPSCQLNFDINQMLPLSSNGFPSAPASHLNAGWKPALPGYDAGKMPALPGVINGVRLEITKPNTFFETANSRSEDNTVALSQYYPGKQGGITVNLTNFPASGIYQCRLRAIDKNQSPCGFAGDQIMITVNK
jgi:hypothetical protein